MGRGTRKRGSGKLRKQRNQARTQAEIAGVSGQLRQAYDAENREILGNLLGRHIVANLGKFHAKNRPVRIIHDENGKGYAFGASKEGIDKKQSKLRAEVYPGGIVRLAGIRKAHFDLLQLSRYGFQWDNSQYRHGKANKIRTIGCIAKLGDIDRQKLRFNANLACLLELLP